MVNPRQGTLHLAMIYSLFEIHAQDVVLKMPCCSQPQRLLRMNTVELSRYNGLVLEAAEDVHPDFLLRLL